MGAVVAAWGDMGLHTETFWLGYATATSAAWNPKADARALMASFYPLHYGPDVVRMDRAYQLLVSRRGSGTRVGRTRRRKSQTDCRKFVRDLSYAHVRPRSAILIACRSFARGSRGFIRLDG